VPLSDNRKGFEATFETGALSQYLLKIQTRGEEASRMSARFLFHSFLVLSLVFQGPVPGSFSFSICLSVYLSCRLVRIFGRSTASENMVQLLAVELV
jgi:hypothetical protein